MLSTGAQCFDHWFNWEPRPREEFCARVGLDPAKPYVVYLGGGFDVGEEEMPDVLQMRRRDWTPWEFERACRNLAHRLQAQVKRVETGPVDGWPAGEVATLGGGGQA